MTAFFLLSGFALYYTNYEKNFNIRIYYSKRFISIVPVYWIVSILFIIKEFIVGRTNIIDDIILSPFEILGLQTVFCSLFSKTHNGGTWFISCVLICYVLFPFALWLIKQIKFKLKIVLCLIMGGILLYAPIVVHYFKLDSIYSDPFFRMLEFYIGALLCSIWTEIKNKGFYKKFLSCKAIIFSEALLLIIGVTAAVNLNIAPGNYMLYNWIGLPLYSGLILGLAGLDLKTIRNSKVIKYAVAISYTFFLAQLFVWDAVKLILIPFGGHSNINEFLKMVISFIVCVLIAVLLHECIEKPVTNFLNKRYRGSIK